MIKVRNETPSSTVEARKSFPMTKETIIQCPCAARLALRLRKIDFYVVIRTQLVVDAARDAGIHRSMPQENPEGAVPHDTLRRIDQLPALAVVVLRGGAVHQIIILGI